MATYDINSPTFNIDNIDEGDTLLCNYTGGESSITLPPGTYRFTVTGATGKFGARTSTTSSTYTSVGGGGVSVGEISFVDDATLYINVGGLGADSANTSAVNTGGYNGGGSTNYYGGTGGGATHIALRSGLLSSLSSHRSDILIVAGGGGGSTYYGTNYYGNGGSGGGTSGVAGKMNGSASTAYAGQPGTQTAGGAAGTNTTRPGTAGSFGQGGSNTGGTSSYASSGGGGGYFGGGAASNQEAGGGGGSGFISALLSNASTTQGSATSTASNGSATIYIIALDSATKYSVDLNLSGGNFTSGHKNGIYQVREGGSLSCSFIPLDSSDPVTVYKDGVDVSSSLTQEPLTSSLSVTGTVSGASYGFTVNTSGYYQSNNKAVAKSAAVARVNIVAVSVTTVTFSVINYAEQGYDFGVLGNLDVAITPDYKTDNSGYWNGAASTKNTSAVQTVTYTVPIGSHFIDVKYIKDDATDSNNDTLQFKVAMVPAAGTTVTQYSYNSGSITADAEIKIICGDVSSNFTITASGEHASISPESETVYKGSEFELHFNPIDTEDYRYVGVLDNNTNVTSSVVAPHTLPNPSFEVQSVSGASYGFALSSGYYTSQNNSNNSAALCKVVFETPVPATVTITYQNTGYSTSNFSMISELNTDLRTDYATDTSGMAMNGSNNFHSSDTDLVFNIPAGGSYITCKHKITSSNQTKGNLKFKVSIVPNESLDVPYYTYTIANVQGVHNIVILSEKIPEYLVNITCGPMGAISPAGEVVVKEGGSITVNCTPDTNYITGKIFVNSVSQSFSNDSITVSNINQDTNIYVLFSSGDTAFYVKSGSTWSTVIQAYQKINGRWVAQEFELIGDPYTKYVRKS